MPKVCFRKSKKASAISFQSETIRGVQRQLQRLYDLPDLPWADEFLCTEEVARRAVGDAVDRGEVLIVRESGQGADVGLYLHSHALEARTLQQKACVQEGVSHLVYLLFRATHDQRVSELELELQAEVDKYALQLLEGWGVGFIRARSERLRRSLFEQVTFLDDAHSERGERYRKANEVASSYALELESRFVRSGDMTGFSHELRRFYRRGLLDKLESV